MDEPQFDVIAVGAHPDDVEILCGGTVAKLAKQGYRVGIIDLTDGEPTPGSPGPEVRLAEARRAAEVLGAAKRIVLDLPNRRLFDSFEARVALAKEFRRFRPRVVLAAAERTPTASPDHYQASLIVEAAVFYSRLTKWDAHFEGLPVHRVERYLTGYVGFHSFGPPPSNGIVVDIGDVLEKKMEAIACYQTQFPPERAATLDRFRIFAQHQGIAAGFGAGEVLLSPMAWGTRDLMGLLFEKPEGSHGDTEARR